MLKILFINFMKKTDDDDHEMSSTCFPSVSSRKRVLKTSFTKKGWYLQARSQSGLKLTSHSWGTMHRSPGKRNNMWCLMGSQNAQHTGWVVADNISSKAYRLWDSRSVFLGKAKHLRGSNPSIIRVCVAHRFQIQS